MGGGKDARTAVDDVEGVDVVQSTDDLVRVPAKPTQS